MNRPPKSNGPKGPQQAPTKEQYIAHLTRNIHQAMMGMDGVDNKKFVLIWWEDDNDTEPLFCGHPNVPNQAVNALSKVRDCMLDKMVEDKKKVEQINEKYNAEELNVYCPCCLKQVDASDEHYDLIFDRFTCKKGPDKNE